MQFYRALNERLLKSGASGAPPTTWVDRGGSFEAFRLYRSSWLTAMWVTMALMMLDALVADRVHNPALSVLMASLPLAGIAAALIAFARYVSSWDELERRIAIESAAVAALAAAFVAIASVWMHAAAAVRPIDPKWILAVLCGAWLVANPILRQTYR